MNRGLSMAQGHYIARMDSDDIAYPNRIEKQLAFMEKHLNYIITGAHYELIDADGKKGRKVIIPKSDTAIRFRMLLSYPFCHPTVMYRADVLKAHDLNYNPACRRAQDYELLVRFVASLPLAEISNMPDYLMQYRKHSQSITTLKSIENGQDRINAVTPYHQAALSTEFF